MRRLNSALFLYCAEYKIKNGSIFHKCAACGAKEMVDMTHKVCARHCLKSFVANEWDYVFYFNENRSGTQEKTSVSCCWFQKNRGVHFFSFKLDNWSPLFLYSM